MIFNIFNCNIISYHIFNCNMISYNIFKYLRYQRWHPGSRASVKFPLRSLTWKWNQTLIFPTARVSLNWGATTSNVKLTFTRIIRLRNKYMECSDNKSKNIWPSLWSLKIWGQVRVNENTVHLYFLLFCRASRIVLNILFPRLRWHGAGGGGTTFQISKVLWYCCNQIALFHRYPWFWPQHLSAWNLKVPNSSKMILRKKGCWKTSTWIFWKIRHGRVKVEK